MIRARGLAAIDYFILGPYRNRPTSTQRRDGRRSILPSTPLYYKRRHRLDERLRMSDYTEFVRQPGETEGDPLQFQIFPSNTNSPSL